MTSQCFAQTGGVFFISQLKSSELRLDLYVVTGPDNTLWTAGENISDLETKLDSIYKMKMPKN